MEILTGVQTVNDYPYGRLKCEMSFSVECNTGKGFRSVMQSVNPKTGRVNKPKKSTYYQYVLMYKEEGTGHIKFRHFIMRDFIDIAKFIQLLHENEIKFTENESQDLWAVMISIVKVSARFSTLNEGIDVDHFMKATKAQNMINLYAKKSCINEIKYIGFDLAIINSLRKK